MDGQLADVLAGREENHLMPFLWIRAGEREKLPDYVQTVYDSGARAFCVESRTHEYFGQKAWWLDMDVLLAEAEKRGMRVWLLDDKRFPTGFANGRLAQRYPQHRKWQLIENHVDVIGPGTGNAVLLKTMEPEDELIGVYAYLRPDHEETITGEAIDLTANVHGHYLYWDIPRGVYRLFFLYKTRRGTDRPDYIHMIDEASVRVLIEAVYEPHYQHYQRYFGNTFAGFFSDEPSFSNDWIDNGGNSYCMYEKMLGQTNLALPWSDNVLGRMRNELGRDARALLPALWFTHGQYRETTRVAYMNAITKLWREAFSMQIGNWCRAHGILYIGHIIEDNNAHARLGSGAGHYFRALDGQDMAGIDVVLHQIIPGLCTQIHAASCDGEKYDARFFDYVLAKLASSQAHLQPRMCGRAMCEVFGAYGWAEGVPMMKALMDHLLIRGINQFVPHAFSLKYPDPDCPPHFNACGHNPEFAAFSALMRYTNQVCHLLEGSLPVLDAAILYHAEAEWSGSPYMLTEIPAKALYDKQLNYEIVPQDAIMGDARIEDGGMRIRQMFYPVLILPYAKYLPTPFVERLNDLIDEGLRVLCVDASPDGLRGACVTALSVLPEAVRGIHRDSVRLAHSFAQLRVLHARRGDVDLFMLSNESSTDPWEDSVYLPSATVGVRLDLLGDQRYGISVEDGSCHLRLASGESTLLLFGDEQTDLPAPRDVETIDLNTRWTLSLRDAEGESRWSEPRLLDRLYDMTGPEGDDAFSGWMRYETRFTSAACEVGIDLGFVGEVAEISLNGIALGLRMANPYTFDFRDALSAGENCLTVVVANSLVHRHPDPFSHYIQIRPSGLLGPVRLMVDREKR
ncbi:MAG: hypothetical protein RSD95_06120 [Clostridia bacterium]